MTLILRQAEGLTGSVTQLSVNNGESIFQSFLESLDDSLFEVKKDFYRNGRMVVEVEQNPNKKGWKPSGLMVTKAKWWIYLFSDDAFVAVEVDRLKKYINNNCFMLFKFFGQTKKQTLSRSAFRNNVAL